MKASEDGEDVLRVSDAQWKALGESTLAIIALLDLDGTVRWVNRVPAPWRVQDVIGKPASRFAGREAAERLQSALLEAMELKQPVTFEAALDRPDGSTGHREVTLSPVMGPDGAVTSVVLMATDVTRLRSLERELDESRERLRTLLASSPLAIILVDREENVLFWNPAAEQLFGWTEAEVLNRPLPIVPEHKREEAEANRQAWLAGHRFVNLEQQRMRKDGTVVDIRIDTAILRDRQGQINYCMALCRDITEEKRLQAELQQRERELLQAQKMEAVGRLAGGIAHDFNNLLTAIAGNADLILSRLDPADERTHEVLEILDAAKRAAELTQGLLAFSRRQVLRPRAIDLNAAVGDSLRLLSRLLGEDVELVFEPDTEPACVRVDPIQLQQVIINLAINARDAMPRGGRLTITTGTIRLGCDSVSEPQSGLAAQDGLLRSEGACSPGLYRFLVVADTGCGMDADTLSHVFEPFFTTKQVGKGTGLGLAMVYGFVMQSGGTIKVESALDRGTTVSVFLPAASLSGEADTTQESATSSRSTGDGGSVLLVEDEDSVRRLTERVLRAAGYAITAVSNPAEALKRLEHDGEQYDLLLTDVVLPGMDGWELAMRVREFSPSLRVLFTSGHPRSALPALSQHPEARLLEKPYTRSQLLTAVREVLGSR